MYKKVARYVYESFRLESNFIYDYFKYKRNYSKENNLKKTEKNLTAWILQDKHRIEKGLSLPNPRLLFGLDVIKRLSLNLSLISEEYGKSEVYFLGVASLVAYKRFHESKDVIIPNEILNLINEFKLGKDESIYLDKVGVSDLIIQNKNFEQNFYDLAQSRKSVRNFNLEYVDNNTLAKAMKLAITAPSVCNRQHWRVDFIEGSQKDAVLNLQNGNAGFRETIHQIAIISSDLSAFYNGDERNQMYTDGGIFTMNLLYAFHSLGVSTCTLNWSASALTEYKFNKLKIIPTSNQVIVLVALGYAEEFVKVAKSPKLPLSTFYKVHYEK
ncbi:nitroreductase family protein [Photobacterium carnosum]|uniref:nitroreductase family protein n=1 Tax=Photobacterium carnosum TaxID=2023717 RepID=UPI001E453095|nr:nitroreductase family protein [Photobacterium carnosum]MCD9529096.1 hypothetical protein [Photobacterium carnosum]